MPKPQTHDDYLAQVAPDKRAPLTQLRALIHQSELNTVPRHIAS